MTHRQKAAIVGTGELKPTRTPGGKSSLEIMAEAAKMAIEEVLGYEYGAEVVHRDNLVLL